MKNKFLQTASFLFFLIVASGANAQTNTFPSSGKVGIGTTSPNVSSILEVKSTTKGILIPRMTQAQRNAIASPAKGLLIYQTDATPGFYYYNGTAWTAVSPKAKGWSLTGNAGTNSSTNFIGTTDAHPLVFRVNNQKAGWIDYSATSANTGFGHHTLNVNTTGGSNAAFGYNALLANTTGSSNTATGSVALAANTTGSNNTANGYASLYKNTTGYFNTASGNGALYSNTTGHHNTASGLDALYSDTSGTYNTADGVFALYSNTNGSYNTASGYQALYFNTTGSDNTAQGNKALYSNTTGQYNTATGEGALLENTTGSDNTANGDAALDRNTTGHDNTANGNLALYSNTTGYYNTANGVQALDLNTTGTQNTASGYQALLTNTTGTGNTALGYAADVSTNNLTNATAIGYHAQVAQSNSLILGGTGNYAVRVGIGTSSPQYTLSVNGTIQAKEVRVETGWSDFVFEKNYKLRSLNDVASYIEKYKHLPDIPSAKEIQTNGLPVADMQTKMMAKIEELTLYIIDLQKQIEELKAEKK